MDKVDFYSSLYLQFKIFVFVDWKFPITLENKIPSFFGLESSNTLNLNID